MYSAAFGLTQVTPGISVSSLCARSRWLQQATAGSDQIIDALVAAQRGLDRELPRHVGAQAHRGQHVQAFDVVPGVALLARHDHPAGAIAAGAVVLRQAVEGDEQHVVGQRGDRCVRRAVVQHLVVDLVGEDDQLMLARDLDDLAAAARPDTARRSDCSG